VFRFTSLDRDMVFDGNTYQTCASLSASAAQSSADQGAVGNTELTGILKSTAISIDDVYAGKFNDAYCEVWIVPWEGAEAAHRIAAGWAGEVQFSEKGFTMEVLGPGSRLEQQALVQVYTPGCRWSRLGATECGVDVEALALTGTVVSATNRGAFNATISDSSDGGIQFVRGRVRWTSGDNNTELCEIKTIDFGTGDIVLWALAGFIPTAGDTFDILPGCDQSKETCINVYNNFVNFGGFPDVPGTDAILDRPNAKA